MNNEYVTGLYKYLQGQYGSEFKLSPQQFENKLNTDPNYVNGLHGYLKEQYGSEFVLTPDEFAGKVKKKGQSSTGSNQIPLISGSEVSQSKAPKFGEVNTFASKKENEVEFPGQLPEAERKAVDILSQKPSLKFVEDEDLKSYIRQNPKAWTDELIKNNPSLKDQTIDGVLPGLMDEEPTIDSQSAQNLENANKLIDYTKSYDQDFDNLPKESDSFTEADIKANPKKYRNAVLNDYLQYLKVKHGEEGQAYLDVKERLDYYNSLGDKLYNDSAYGNDLKRYQDIQKEALSKISNNSYAKSVAIENNYDWNYYSKKAADLDNRARLVEKQLKELGLDQGKVLSVPQQQKYDELTSQYNQIQDEFSKLSQETNIDDSVMNQMRDVQQKMNNVKSSIDYIDNEKGVNAESIREYNKQKQANKKAQEEFYNTQNDGNFVAHGKGLTMIAQQAASTFTKGIFDIAKMPEIVGEAFGSKGYGWTDKMSEAADNVSTIVDLYSPELDQANFSNFMKFNSSLGKGLGSVAQFFAAGSGASKLAKGLRLSEKGLEMANKTAQFVAASSTSTAQMYNEYLQLGFTPEEAARYGLGSGVIMGMAEMIVPEDELLKNEVKQSIIASIKSGATRKEAFENALKHIALKTGKTLSTTGKESFEEGVGYLAEASSKQISSTLSDKKIDGIWNIDDFNANAFGGGQVGFILELMKFGSKSGRNSNPFEENLVGYLAENYDKMVDVLSKTHPEDYDKMADRFGKLKEVYEGLKNTPAFNKLSKTDQDHVLAQAHTKQVILENIKQSGLDKAAFADDIASIDEDIFQTLNGLRSKDTWVDKSKTQQENAVQESSTEEVLPRQQGTTPETGGQPQGMGQGVQGQEVTQEGQEVSQEGLTPEQQVSQDAGDVIAEVNPPSTLAASVYPVIGEIETAIENNQPVNEEKLNDAEDKLYSLLDEIDSREDLTPDQKQRMASVIENRIAKLQNYDNRTRTQTSTSTQAVAAGRVEKTQKPNERATTPIRTVAEEGIDVTYDGRPGRVELRNGEYVFVPKKLGAVQARPIVIGEAAQVNANSTFAGVENPTKGQNNSVANITLPNGSTLAVMNDDLSIDIGLEIAKKEIGAAPQSLFDTVFDEVVSEQKKEVPVQKKEEAKVETTEEAQQPTQKEEQVKEAKTEQAAPYTGVTPVDRSLKQKYKNDFKKRRILDQAQRIANALGLDVPIFIHETTEEYEAAVSGRKSEEGSKQQVGNGLRNLPDGLEIVDGWYSAIEKRLLETKVDKQSANKWLTGGLIGKGDEAIYTGVKAWLESKNPQDQVSKKDILDFMKNNRVEIKEIEKSADSKIPRKEAIKVLEENGYTVDVDRNGDSYIEDGTGETMALEWFPVEVQPYAAAYLSQNTSGYTYGVDLTKYSAYVLPGAANDYKEVLVTLPNNKQTENIRFVNNHFEEENILVHLRMNVRTDENGNKVLFLEEVQSDWGQKGKKEGFNDENSINDKIKKLEDKKYELTNKLLSTNDYNEQRLINQELKPVESELTKYQIEKLKGGTPKAPFVTNTNAWVKLGLKIALREAEKQGVDYIAWTTGSQQNDRYALSNVINSINVKQIGRTEEGIIYNVESEYNTGEVTNGEYKQNELEGVFGKELAQKIIDNNGGQYSGVDLEVGGKGMKSFYDKIVPDVFQSLMKEVTGNATNIESLNINGNQQQAIPITSETKTQVKAGLSKFQSTNGQFIYSEDGSVKEIHINLSEANERTIAHEAAHAVLFKAFGDNQALFQEFKDRLAKILKESTVKELEDFANNSAYVSQGVSAEEFLAELAGKMTADEMRIPKTTLQKIAKLINEFVGKITKGKVKVFEDTANTADVIDFFNSMADAFSKGKTFNVESKTKTGSSKLSSKFQYDFSDSVSKLSFVYDKNSDTFKKLEKQGYITKNKKLQDFAGKFIFLHQPDAAFSGMIYKDGQLLVEGKGGMFYPIKFHKDGYFWASTNTTAEKMAKDLNKVLKQNGGTIYMALTSAPYNKLMSSTTMSNAVLDFFSSKAFDQNFNISPKQLKEALVQAANYTKIKTTKNKKTGVVKEKQIGLNLGLSSNANLESIQSAIKNILGPDNSSFDDRKTFVLELTRIIAEEIKNDPVAIKQFGKLFSEGIQNKYFKGETKTGKLSISAANMVQAMSEMFTEPILKEGVNREKGGQVYAILELKGKVKPIDSKKHESYPKAIQSDSKEKVTLHILTDRENWADNFEDPETGELISKEREKKLFPTSGVSVTGLKLKSKSESKAKPKAKKVTIPKAKAQESSMVSEMNQAMNKTGLAKENAVKRFIEKYGQNGLVAKEIIDNFDKIQEQLGITKICNI